MTPLQEHIYKILVVVDRMCEEHNIPYFMIGGTALGALRHKGFIPWDDDADIGMLRPDYERFLKLCATELPDGYALKHFSVEPQVTFSYIKITNTRAWMRYLDGSHQFVRANVNLDIFPLDNVLQNSLKRRAQLASLFFIQSLLEVKHLNHAAPRWRNRMLVRFLRPMLSGRMLIKLFDRVSAWEKSNTTRDVWQAESQYPRERQTYQRQWVAQRRRAKFEHNEFWIPAEAELFLERTYGDYMTPPPPEKRVAHGGELLSDESP